MIPQWKQAGYQVVLFFLQLPSEDLAVARVADRVSQGGHDIPEAVIRRRFHAGIANFHALYKPLVDDWRLYDHSGERPILICSSNPS
jgi:predicted ABC-type ATPase